MDDPENNAFESGSPVIYTVGTSTHSREEFLDLLRAYGIGAVLDVRRFPTSRRYPHFNRTSLASWLAASGISYHYLGDSLGGYRRGSYEAYTTTAAFRQGLEEAMDLAARGPAAIMCCERFPWRCHRRFIARHLAALGWQVVHILDHDSTYVPANLKTHASVIGEREKIISSGRTNR
ncbi:MAG: DUF488 domain-containing protein [Bacillota bacterium]